MVWLVAVYFFIAIVIFNLQRFQGFVDIRSKLMIIGLCLFWPLALITLGLIWLKLLIEPEDYR